MCTHIAGFLPSINLEGYSLVKKYIEAISLPKKEDMVNDYLVQLNNIKHVAKKGTKEVVSSIGKLNKLSLIKNRHKSDRLQNKYDNLFGITVRKPEGCYLPWEIFSCP